MARVILIVLAAILAGPVAFAAASSPGYFVVSAGTLNVRLANNTSGKVIAKLHRQQEIKVFEVSNGWARISEYYDGAMEGMSGNIAHWVFATHLTPKLVAIPQPVREPATPPMPEAIDVSEVDTDSPTVRAISASDDFLRHYTIFVAVTDDLVDSGECKLSDFEDIGGWWRSAAHQPRLVYYTYCGGASNSDRIFLDTVTRDTFK